MKRVVVTGMGAITPFGFGVDVLWKNLLAGNSAITPFTDLARYSFPMPYGGQMPQMRLEDHLPASVKVDSKKADRLSLYTTVAAYMALTDAGFSTAGENDIDIIVGSGIGPCASNELHYGTFATKGWKAISPLGIIACMPSGPASAASIALKLTGEHFVVGLACSSGAVAIGRAFRTIRHEGRTAVLAGGADMPLTPSIIGPWTNMRVLSKNPVPHEACRPFDKNRDGLVLSEGAAFLLLEELESALARGAKIYGEILGYGSSSDATHFTVPSQKGQATAMRNALKDAGVAADGIDYINAHGTSTITNDKVETAAIKDVFGIQSKKIPVSSIKSMLGHTMGASGALEAIATILAIRGGAIPPTINYGEPDEECDLDYVPNVARAARVTRAISNSFGFGGGNAVLVFGSFQP
jgi:beta-ketoacyl-acyl-carrier-protein synthase II